MVKTVVKKLFLNYSYASNQFINLYFLNYPNYISDIKKKFKLILTDTVLFTSILLVNLTCIIIIPEIRYYWGPHISLSIFLLTIVIFSMNINITRNRNQYSACLLLPLFLFIFFIQK